MSVTTRLTFLAKESFSSCRNMLSIIEHKLFPASLMSSESPDRFSSMQHNWISFTLSDNLATIEFLIVVSLLLFAAAFTDLKNAFIFCLRTKPCRVNALRSKHDLPPKHDDENEYSFRSFLTNDANI